jgi:hypothetical protein
MTEQTFTLDSKTYNLRLEKSILLDWFYKKMNETTPMSPIREAAITTLLNTYNRLSNER